MIEKEKKMFDEKFKINHQFVAGIVLWQLLIGIFSFFSLDIIIHSIEPPPNNLTASNMFKRLAGLVINHRYTSCE
jgi:hypothetical protein